MGKFFVCFWANGDIQTDRSNEEVGREEAASHHVTMLKSSL